MPHSTITQLLHAWNDGDPTAFDRLAPLVYEEMRLIAHAYVSREKSEVTMQPTELVHETCLRLMGQRHHNWKERKHFYGVAAKVMRRVLMDLARQREAVRHGATRVRVTLSERNGPTVEHNFDFLALNEALEALEKLDRRQVEIVELRFFSDLSVEETAEALDISAATVKREWACAKAWLLRELSRDIGSR
jgi:RNA polymerase sigma-70 factor (ECF subfamily)